ncbi:MAG: N-acyl-D-amino-acid deacylase family protein [Gemmatimonadaceae bacterium]
MGRNVVVACTAVVAFAGACRTAAPRPLADAERQPSAGAVLIVNALVIDGTGSAPRRASVRILGDRIAAVGDLRPSSGDEVIDARGLALAPGFIDTHSHADGHLAGHRDALAHVSQGITTAIVGQDGGSWDTLSTFFARLERTPGALSVASYVGHNTVRYQILGDDYKRPATSEEIERMKALVAEGMRAGALGLSTGLEYDPGIYSTPNEVIALAAEAARHGGRYISHIRSEDRAFWAAVDELLEIGRRANMERGADPARTYLELIREAEALRADSARRRALAPDGVVEMVIGTSMDDRDIEALMRWPHANIASDGSLVDRHPRGAGVFPRVLGRYVRERRVVTLADAVRKMTSLSAAHVGIVDRGMIAVGQHADLVLFDTARVLDRATPNEPHRLSVGIDRLWVNGEIVYENGQATGRYPGRVLRRTPSRSFTTPSQRGQP